MSCCAAFGGVWPRIVSRAFAIGAIGIKSDLFDGGLRANLAVFSMEVENFQVLDFDVFGVFPSDDELCN